MFKGGVSIKRFIALALVCVLLVPCLIIGVSASTVYEFFPFEMPAVYADYDFIGADDETFICDGLVPEGQYRLEIDLNDVGSEYDVWIVSASPFDVSYGLVGDVSGAFQSPVSFKYFIPDYPDQDDPELASTFDFVVALWPNDGSTFLIIRDEQGAVFPTMAAQSIRMISVDPESDQPVDASTFLPGIISGLTELGTDKLTIVWIAALTVAVSPLFAWLAYRHLKRKIQLAYFKRGKV